MNDNKKPLPLQLGHFEVGKDGQLEDHNFENSTQFKVSNKMAEFFENKNALFVLLVVGGAIALQKAFEHYQAVHHRVEQELALGAGGAIGLGIGLGIAKIKKCTDRQVVSLMFACCMLGAATGYVFDGKRLDKRDIEIQKIEQQKKKLEEDYKKELDHILHDSHVFNIDESKSPKAIALVYA